MMLLAPTYLDVYYQSTRPLLLSDNLPDLEIISLTDTPGIRLTFSLQDPSRERAATPASGSAATVETGIYH